MPDAHLELSVVVPVYGCRASLVALYERLTAALRAITPDYELLLVDDGTADGSWDVLAGLAAADPAVRALRLSRNFGQDAAITAGLTRSAGRWVVVMDCDLQEPPEAIPELYTRAQEGFEVVRTVRGGRQHTRLRRAASRAYRRLLLERARDVEYSNMSLLSRKVVDAYLSLNDSDREFTLALDWLGFPQAAIAIDYQPRAAGESSYTLARLLRVALAGMTFRTTVLLRVVVFIGFLVAILGVGLAAYNVYERFAGHQPAGYTSLVVLTLVLGGFIILSVGVVGLYVGRIFEQVRRRPLFLVDREVGGPAAEAEAARGTERESTPRS
jgi:glycosyltransferase involved in cell wall biosynthesis